MRRRRAAVLAWLLSLGIGSPAAAASGPCSDAATQAMPEGTGHDHLDASQHNMGCGLRVLSFLSLQELVPEPVDFGELDVAGHFAAEAISYPRAGFVLVNVADPVSPRALSRFNGPECERVVMDYDCGADVKLSYDSR